MPLFTSLHNISHADGIFYGNSNYSPGISKWLRDGQPVTAPFRYDWDAVAIKAGKVVGLFTFATNQTSGTMNINGNGTWTTNANPATAGGTGTADAPRAVSVSTKTFGTPASYVIYGTDYYGEALTEKIGVPSSTGNQTVNGKKAFKTVTCLVQKTTLNSTSASGVMVGFSNILGLPFAIAGAWDMLTAWADTTALTVDATAVVAGDTTTATAKTGDPRGTFLPTTLPNGSRKFRVWFTALGKDTRNNLYGVPQFGGSA